MHIFLEWAYENKPYLSFTTSSDLLLYFLSREMLENVPTMNWTLATSWTLIHAIQYVYTVSDFDSIL
jgi:EamA domain-containing membrane protein RarD